MFPVAVECRHWLGPTTAIIFLPLYSYYSDQQSMQVIVFPLNPFHRLIIGLNNSTYSASHNCMKCHSSSFFSLGNFKKFLHSTQHNICTVQSTGGFLRIPSMPYHRCPSSPISFSSLYSFPLTSHCCQYAPFFKGTVEYYGSVVQGLHLPHNVNIYQL